MWLWKLTWELLVDRDLSESISITYGHSSVAVCQSVIRGEQMQKYISLLFYIVTHGTPSKAYVNKYDCKTFSCHCAERSLRLDSTWALMLELASTLLSSQTLQMEDHMKRLLLCIQYTALFCMLRKHSTFLTRYVLDFRCIVPMRALPCSWRPYPPVLRNPSCATAFSACLTTYQGLYSSVQGKEGGGDFFPRPLVLSVLLWMLRCVWFPPPNVLG